MASISLFAPNNGSVHVNTLRQAIDMMNISNNMHVHPEDSGVIFTRKNEGTLAIYPVRRNMESKFSAEVLDTMFPYYQNVGSKLMWAVVDFKAVCLEALNTNHANQEQVVPEEARHVIGLVDTFRLLQDIY